MGEVQHIFLVGYMGCGKSTLGRKLARRLGWRLVDTDHEVEALEGASVSDIFRYEGEEIFRLREREVLEGLIGSELPLVVATGGGLPLWQDNMERMCRSGLTLYIRRSAGNIASRLSPYGRQKRPKLRGLSDDELVAFMEQNIRERSPYYERATLILEGDKGSDEELIEEILAYIRKR
uniref:shikimate kinase n=1 Tax=Alistipes sp. TaxID=1872444 RepID=UPI0040565415